MPLGDVSYVDAALDAVVASWPATGAHYCLFASDPQIDPIATAELSSSGGYARVTFAPSGWASASAGSKSTTAAVSFGTSTGAYSDTALYWGIVDGSGLLVFSDFLDDPIEVDDTGTAVSLTPTLVFGDGA